MNPIYVRRTVNLDGLIPQEFLRGNLYMGENLAHTFVISATQDGAAYSLSGTVTGMLLRSDGTTVRLTGSCSGGMAFLPLSSDCYNINGRVSLTIYVAGGGRTDAVYSMVSSVHRTSSDTVIDQGNPLPDIGDIIDAYMEAITVIDDVKEIRQMTGYHVDLGSAISGKFPNYSELAIWDGADYKYWKEVPVYPGATYVWTGIFNSVCGAFFLDANKEVISDSGINTQTFTVPSNAYYIDIGTIGTSLTPSLIMIGDIQREIEADTGYPGASYVPIPVTTQTGVTTKYGTVNSGAGVRAELDVKPGEKYRITGYVYSAVYPDDDPNGDTGFVYPLAFAYNTTPGRTTTIPYSATSQGPGMVYQLEYTVPAFANKICINAARTDQIAVLKQVDNLQEKLRQISGDGVGTDWEGKTIVWFGTSIPAGGFLGSEHPMSYPYQVGRLLGATVINEAVGSSCIHCKSPDYITEANPRGFNPNFEASSRCLTNSDDDYDWIIEHDDASFWTNKGEYDGGEWWQNKIRSFGYNEMIDKYLTASTFPDLFIFDHGFNDPFVDMATRQAYNTAYPSLAWQYSYNAGMDFLIQRILSYRPDAKILLIGCYAEVNRVPEMQSEVSKAWNLPLVSLWQFLGWTKTRQIQQYGHWSQVSGTSDWEWITDSSTSWMTVFARWVPDGIHPHTYPGHVAETRMAEVIAAWMLGKLQYTTPFPAYTEELDAHIAEMIAAALNG